ncbi:thyroid receptor-interacting protein 11-like [Zophobas morio]|uniref:thyroid receptor-interacting protein 11-like n=1 Tax=Zophobas morio TaxID=2755281 RepID=UPI0030831E35
MSWLNLNDSLNTLKGQISNFANNVLADDDEGKDPNSPFGDLKELQETCNKQQEEINYLRRLNAELSGRTNANAAAKDGAAQSNENWSWEVSDSFNPEEDQTAKIITDLKTQISQLQNEKQELTSNLVLLDNEHQLSNEKLINMKNKLQKEYNELEDDYNKLKKENELLITNQKESEIEIENLKTNNGLSLKKTVASADEVSSKKTCVKCERFLQENQKLQLELEKLINEITILKSNNATLHKVLDDSKNANDEECSQMKEKAQLLESENKILITELKNATQSISEFEKKSQIDAENCRKLAMILEGYEQQVSCLKQDLLVKESQCTADLDKLKNDVITLQEQLQQAVVQKEHTHTKYVHILTENMKRYIDSNNGCEDVVRDSENEVDPQVSEFSHQVESILNLLIDLKSKCECLEKELFSVTEEKTNILTEKNHEIEKLIQNSEILSQEVITKSQTLKDYENECNELIKNNDILINELKMLKNNSGLQTISESNEDNILMLESQLETANKKIEELEDIVSQKENNFVNETTSEKVEQQYVTMVSYEKLLEDLNESKKENSILQETVMDFERASSSVTEQNENLASTLEKLRLDLENTEYQYTEMNINMEVLKEELENHRRRIEEHVEQKISLEKSNLELERNNEDLRSELNIIREKLLMEEDNRRQCESQIRNFTEKLQNAKMCETSLKLQYDTISKELTGTAEARSILESDLKNCLAELTQCKNQLVESRKENETLKTTVTEMENKFETLQTKTTETTDLVSSTEKNVDNKIEEDQFQNVSLIENSNDEKLPQDNVDIPLRYEQLQLQYDSIVKEKDYVTAESEKLKSVATEHLKCGQSINILEKKLEELNSTKNELTNVIITKHQESVTYHNEIQRLTQVLNAESEKNRNLEAQIQTLSISVKDNTEIEKKCEEIDKLTDQNQFLKQKCEVLAQNLLEEQNKIQQILAERSSFSEKEQSLTKKLERLQAHLIEVEEHYTHELLRAEERNTELQAKVNEIEQREKNSSTMYTSVSIRANQHVETLQHQLHLITNQRDELRKKISDAEDHASKQEAALANLQFVLEQFQKDKEKDVQKETERIRRQINIEKKVQEELKNDIAGLQLQLEESKHGLLAASRLSDQLEQSKQLITTLKTEVSQLKEKLHKNEEHLQSLSSQSDGKVDKSLIKNLIIGFVSTNNNLNKDQMQILKIIATVLDFNQQEHDKVNLSKPQQGWLSSFMSPQTSQGMSQESLSQAFVKFLENESKPRLVPSLLNNSGETPKSRKTSSTSAPRQSPSILSEVVLPTFADFAQNRNSSSILKDVLKDNS